MRSSFGALFALVTLTAVGQATPLDQQNGNRFRKPPPINVHFLQSGVGLAAQLVPSAGTVCPADANTPCILGGGVGLAVRVGHRARTPYYLGGAYEVTRHDSSNLHRLAILQQIRAEARRYVDFGTRLVPYGLVGLGAAVYGNEFGVETGGFVGTLALGAEYQLSRAAAAGWALGYRPLVVRRWTDSAGELRADGPAGFGIAHMIGLEFTIEMRRQLSRW
ncbi:MAG: hypothetical protein JW751_24035 [Polyangiaceae bacterium]|nr:hypothetical protein [Polyangiaceae bacterium]